MKRPLSALDDVKASSELKDRTLQKVLEKRGKHRNWRTLSVVSTIVCACILFFLQPLIAPNEVPQSTDIAYTYVTMDINPSLELQLAKDNTVLDVIAYNEEAKQIVETIEVNGEKVEDAVQILLETPAFQEYLEEGYLQVSVFSDDEEKTVSIEETLNQSISTKVKPEQYSCSRVSKQEKEEADAHHISFGKYQIITAIIELDKDYSITELKDVSMKKLMDVYESLNGSSYPSQDNQHQHKNENGKGKGKNRK